MDQDLHEDIIPTETSQAEIVVNPGAPTSMGCPSNAVDALYLMKKKKLAKRCPELMELCYDINGYYCLKFDNIDEKMETYETFEQRLFLFYKQKNITKLPWEEWFPWIIDCLDYA